MNHVWEQTEHTASCQALPVLGDDLDGADDVPVELLEVPGRNPVLKDGLTTSLLDVVPIEVRLVDHEARDVADPAGPDVPVAGNLLASSSFRTDRRSVDQAAEAATHAGQAA